MRAVGFTARVGGLDVEAVHRHVPAPHLVARQQLHPSRRRQRTECQLAEACATRVIEDRPLLWGDMQTQVVQPIVRRELDTVGPTNKGDGSCVVRTLQRLAGSEPERGNLANLTAEDDRVNRRVARRSRQLAGS
jgi:hypothetical protein